MADYTFSGNPFIINYIYGEGIECSDLADPDRAGIGVIASGIVVAVATNIAAWEAFRLDKKALLSSQQAARRRVLDRTLLSLSDQQLITGVALLVSAFLSLLQDTLYMEDEWDFQDAHFVLVVYQSCLAFTTHLACIIPLRKFPANPAMVIIRLLLTVFFMGCLTLVVTTSHHTFEIVTWILQGAPDADANHVVYADSWVKARRRLPVLALFYLLWISFVQAFDEPELRRDWLGIRWSIRKLRNGGYKWTGHILEFCIFSSPIGVLILQSLYALVFTMLVIAQKVVEPPEVSDYAKKQGIKAWCGLNNDAENKWGFGQIVALAMLLVPLLSAVGTYFEEELKEPPRPVGIPTAVVVPSDKDLASDDVTSVFVRSTDDACWYRRRKGISWSDWESLGGSIISNICALPHDRTLWLFACGTDGTCQQNYRNGDVWSGWESLGGSLVGDIHAVSRHDETIWLFACGTDNKCQQNSRNRDGIWSGWEDLGGSIVGNIQTVSRHDQTLWLFARGTDNTCQQKYWNRSTWSEWESLGGSIIGNICAVLPRFDKTLWLFAHGADNTCQHKHWNDGVWSDWEKLDHSVAGSIAGSICAVSHDQMLWLFARGTDNICHFNCRGRDGKWKGWERFGDLNVGNICAVSQDDNRLELFSLGTRYPGWHKWWDSKTYGHIYW